MSFLPGKPIYPRVPRHETYLLVKFGAHWWEWKAVGADRAISLKKKIEKRSPEKKKK
jgi:hypothetical protein